MATFKRYPKVHRLGKDETDGVLLGTVHVEEKIDGANGQIWVEDNKICIGSRNNKLTCDVHNPKDGDNRFNGFLDYVAKHDGINKLLKDHPEYRLYGEWLVRHTINYKETAYQNFYLFDITTIKDGEEVEEFFPKEDVIRIADKYGILRPEYHGTFDNPTEEQLTTLVGKSVLGDNGEGVVLKNLEFRDAFGNCNYAKIVTQDFKESNAITFGGNNKHSETYWEMWIVNKYINSARVIKIIHKIESEIGKLDLKHTPRVAGSVYHDVLTEEIWEIAKNAGHVDFNNLKRLALRKAVQVYKDILSGSVSVADK